MQKNITFNYLLCWSVSVFFSAATMLLPGGVALGVANTGHSTFMGGPGPWELLVQVGHEGESLRFPIKVDNEDKPENLSGNFPVMGTPVIIKLGRYLPNLVWETETLEQADAGAVVKLIVKGGGVEQDYWLSSDDPAKQTVTSTVGSITIKKLHDANSIEKLVRQQSDSQAVGIVSVWLEGANASQDYVANLTETINIPGSKYKLQVLEYMPHYSIDTETKKIVSRSDKPVNPAIRISVDDGENRYEQWLWSKYPLSPHTKKKFPLRLTFTDFNFSGTEGQYVLVVVPGSEPWLFFSKNGKPYAEKAMLGRAYPFANKEYSFSIEKVLKNGILKTDWKNKTEKLLNPAVIATIEYDGTAQQAVLEFDKTYHHKSKYGTITLLYRRRPESQSR